MLRNREERENAGKEIDKVDIYLTESDPTVVWEDGDDEDCSDCLSCQFYMAENETYCCSGLPSLKARLLE